MIRLKLDFLNHSTKEVINVIVETTSRDAFIQENDGFELVNTGHPDVNYLSYLAEKAIGDLKGFELDGFELVN
tara:strand:- start:564 stop:782 length:219 start_codon:yes stop_codon:yes gene_type:complete